MGELIERMSEEQQNWSNNKMRKTPPKVKSQVPLLLYGMAGMTLKEPYLQNEVSLKIFCLVITNQVLHLEREEKKPASAKARQPYEGVLAVFKILHQENRQKL